MVIGGLENRRQQSRTERGKEATKNFLSTLKYSVRADIYAVEVRGVLAPHLL